MGITVEFIGDQMVIIMSEKYHQMLCKNESITEMCRRILEQMNEVVGDDLVVTRHGSCYICESGTDVWCLGNIGVGVGLDIIAQKKLLPNGHYEMIFDYTDDVVA